MFGEGSVSLTGFFNNATVDVISANRVVLHFAVTAMKCLRS